MIGLPIKGGAWVAALATGIVSGFAGAWYWQANAYGARLASQGLAYQADLTTIANAGAAQARRVLEQQQRAMKALAELDRKYTQEKDKANAENETLRRAVADGTRRLRIAGNCSGSAKHLPDAASTTSLDNARTIELTSTAGRAVLDIRAGIIADQAALMMLQNYAIKVCGRS